MIKPKRLTLTVPPILPTDALWVILTGILGLGAARSFDKKMGTSQ